MGLVWREGQHGHQATKSKQKTHFDRSEACSTPVDFVLWGSGTTTGVALGQIKWWGRCCWSHQRKKADATEQHCYAHSYGMLAFSLLWSGAGGTGPSLPLLEALITRPPLVPLPLPSSRWPGLLFSACRVFPSGKPTKAIVSLKMNGFKEAMLSKNYRLFQWRIP